MSLAHLPFPHWESNYRPLNWEVGNCINVLSSAIALHACLHITCTPAVANVSACPCSDMRSLLMPVTNSECAASASRRNANVFILVEISREDNTCHKSVNQSSSIFLVCILPINSLLLIDSFSWSRNWNLSFESWVIYKNLNICDQFFLNFRS